MINDEELKMNNKSYVNKDFQKIYPEILELAKKLSSKWDPTTSNESDPGVVLLKLLGFMGDKLNYNIDKNILEAFMPTATQESTMRNLCEMNGYYPGYYKSAVVPVSVMYTGSVPLKSSQDAFSLLPFETTFTNEEGDIVFTLLDIITIDDTHKTVSGKAIEGTVETLTVNDEEELHLSNLDDNNRIYFPEKFVAENENGIFIYNIKETAFWNKVDNLNVVEPGNKVFKFGYDSLRGVPYIEFPEDISNLIGEGIIIKYTRTKGESGNIKTGTLVKIGTPSEIYSSNNVLIYPKTDSTQTRGVLAITNLVPTSNGEDPESIDEAYNSFKKVVGTFDTLVTARDYANAIYNGKLDAYTNVVSNVQVADRRTDINYSNQIFTLSKYGPLRTNDTDKSKITPHDVCFYPLNPIFSNYNYSTYNNSFRPLYNLNSIKSVIEKNKTISHDIKKLSEEDIYLFKNYYNLNVKIITTYKVNIFEQEEILQNIKKALMVNFNSRELDYGYEIPYDTLLKVIRGADVRIKNISLEEPELETKVMTFDGTETALLGDDKRFYLNLLAKNILRGSVPLFETNDEFAFEFGQQKLTLPETDDAEVVPTPSDDTDEFFHKNIVSITTEVKIPKSEYVHPEAYLLQDNEVIQAIAPSMVTSLIYPAFVNFYYSGNNGGIDDGSEHTLSSTEKLMFSYKSGDYDIVEVYDNDSKTTYKVDKNITTGEDGKKFYKTKKMFYVSSSPNIFKPIGLDLKKVPVPAKVKNKTIKIEETSYDFYGLSANESVEKVEAVKTELTTASLPCYWITRRENGALFTSEDRVDTTDKYQVVLEEGEEFMYSNSSLTDLEVLGNGTRLTLTVPPGTFNEKDWLISSSQDISPLTIEEVGELGLAAFENYNWRYISLGEDKKLLIEEMKTLTLVKGDKIKITPGEYADLPDNLTNKWSEIRGEIEYFIGDSNGVTLPASSDEGWRVRSRLDLNAGPNIKQTLYKNQKITLKLFDGLDINGEEKYKYRVFSVDKDGTGQIMFNDTLQISGGENIDMSIVYLDNRKTYEMSAVTLTSTPIKYTNTTENPVLLSRGVGGFIELPLKEINRTIKGKAEVGFPLIVFNDREKALEGETQLITLFWDADEGSTVRITLFTYNYSSPLNKTSTLGIRHFNKMEDGEEETEFSKEVVLNRGINTLEITNTETNLLMVEIKNVSNSTSDILRIGKIVLTSGYNHSFNFSEDEEVGKVKGVLEIIRDLDKENHLYYVGGGLSGSLIEFDDLSHPRALFDSNNIANKFTLCQINLDSSKLKLEFVKTTVI